MKRLYGLLVLMFCLLCGSTCFANIADDEVALGGIAYNSSLDYVQSVYGNPTRITEVKRDMFGFYKTYYYGSSFYFEVRNGVVTHLYSAANNGINTPAGVKVGMTKANLEAIYGKPNNVLKDRFGNLDSYYYASYLSFNLGARFYFDKSGRITLISVGDFDG